MCVCKVLPSQTTSYLYISDGTLIVGAGSCTNGAQYSFSFIVEKEKTYKVSDGSNVQQYIIKYIAISMCQ